MQILEKVFPEDSLLNINIPSVEQDKIAGVAVTRLGTIRYKNSFDRRMDPRGKIYYWLAGEAIDNTEIGSDVWAVKNNYISITPLLFDLTKYEVIETIKKWDLQI